MKAGFKQLNQEQTNSGLVCTKFGRALRERKGPGCALVKNIIKPELGTIWNVCQAEFWGVAKFNETSKMFTEAINTAGADVCV